MKRTNQEGSVRVLPESRTVLGFDIGGTKCAVTLSRCGDEIEILEKSVFLTEKAGWKPVFALLEEHARALIDRTGLSPEAIGVSCGGPLSSKKGLILSPPNLIGWDEVPVTAHFSARFGLPVYLQNDANACAVAEWKYGAGRGAENMVFLTFGTGMGAGLILGGRLYAGTSDMAGEVGHLRLAPDGPPGYGKRGSFEGFCSGGGIAELARQSVLAALQRGERVPFCTSFSDLSSLTAQSVARAADEGDALAASIYREVGRRLGEGLSLIADLLNPEVVVIGSIYARSSRLLKEEMLASLSREALPAALADLSVRPAALGERLGDVAAACVGLEGLERE